MWIASQPRAFIVTFLCGLIVGFFLGVHAVMGTNAIGLVMIGFAALGAALGGGLARRRDRVTRECDPPRIASSINWKLF
jgi:phosphatidylglycerophosphate synthase